MGKKYLRLSAEIHIIPTNRQHSSPIHVLDGLDSPQTKPLEPHPNVMGQHGNGHLRLSGPGN
jgi:hypothetical protein